MIDRLLLLELISRAASSVLLAIAASFVLWLVARKALDASPGLARKVAFWGLALLPVGLIGSIGLSLALSKTATPIRLQVPASATISAKSTSPASTDSPIVSAQNPPSAQTKAWQIDAILGGAGIVVLLWVGSIGFQALLAIESRRRLTRSLTDAQLEQDVESQIKRIAEEFQLQTPRIVTSRLDSPFVMNSRSPILAVPRDWSSLEACTRELVLKHELSHIRCGHLFEREVANAALCAFGWLPTARGLAAILADSHEFECDQHAAGERTTRFALAETLIQFAEKRHCHHPAILELSADDSQITRRVTRILAGKTTMGLPKFVGPIVVASTAVLTVAGPTSVTIDLPLVSPSRSDLVRECLGWQDGQEWVYEVSMNNRRVGDQTIRAVTKPSSSARNEYGFETTSSFSTRRTGYTIAAITSAECAEECSVRPVGQTESALRSLHAGAWRVAYSDGKTELYQPIRSEATWVRVPGYDRAQRAYRIWMDSKTSGQTIEAWCLPGYGMVRQVMTNPQTGQITTMDLKSRTQRRISP